MGTPGNSPAGCSGLVGLYLMLPDGPLLIGSMMPNANGQLSMPITAVVGFAKYDGIDGE